MAESGRVPWPHSWIQVFRHLQSQTGSAWVDSTVAW